MVAQAITLAQIAAGLGITIPAAVEYFKGQGIDLSGFGESDLVPLEDLIPQQKTFRTYEESFYKPEPVVGSTVLETKKDDDDIIDVKEEDLEKMPTTEMTRGDEDPEPDDDGKGPKPPGKDPFETLVEELLQRQAQKQFKKAEEFLAKDKNSKQYVETLNPVKIYGDTDVRELDYSNIEAGKIDFDFNDDLLDEIGASSITELDGKTKVDMKALTEKFGFKMPDAEFVNRALEGDAASRFWYEKGAQWVDNFLEGYSDEDKNKFFDILSITSGGVTPKENLKIAIGVFSDYKNGRPIRMGFRQEQSLDKFLKLPDQVVNTPKFGNYVDTFKYFTGLSDREPNTVNDLQMARIFGIKPEILASNPELYALITNSLNRMTFEVNKTLPDGKKLQPYQLQALLWSESRGGSTNYEDMGNELIAELQEKGFKFRNNKLDPIEILDPGFVEKLQATVVPYKEAIKATIEVGSFLTEDGKKIEQLVNNFSDDKTLMNQINLIHRSNLGKLITKKGKEPSIMEMAVSAVVGEKVDISKMRLGAGTYDGKANFNIVVPFTVKVGNKFVELTEPQRMQVLALLGQHLNQEAMAASNFIISDTPIEGRNRTGMLFYQGNYSQEQIQQLHNELGLDFNVKNVPGGFVAEFLTFDNKAPEGSLIKSGFEKVFGDEAEMVYNKNVYWSGDYLEKTDYRKIINGLQRSISTGVLKDNRSPTFDLDYLNSLIKTIQAVSKSRDESYKTILESNKVIKLLQSLKEPIKRAMGGLVESPKFYFGRLIDVYNL